MKIIFICDCVFWIIIIILLHTINNMFNNIIINQTILINDQQILINLIQEKYNSIFASINNFTYISYAIKNILEYKTELFQIFNNNYFNNSNFN